MAEALCLVPPGPGLLLRQRYLAALGSATALLEVRAAARELVNQGH